jgi:hypothetical protein
MHDNDADGAMRELKLTCLAMTVAWGPSGLPLDFKSRPCLHTLDPVTLLQGNLLIPPAMEAKKCGSEGCPDGVAEGLAAAHGDKDLVHTMFKNGSLDTFRKFCLVSSQVCRVLTVALEEFFDHQGPDASAT